MFEGLKWIRLVPDQPGKGGSKSGFHSFPATPMNDTRTTQYFHVYRGRWSKDQDTLALAGITNDVTAGAVNGSLHTYTYPSLTDPSAVPSTTVLGHHVDRPGGIFENRYWDFTHGTNRDSHNGVSTSPNSVPATWLNINGRCFAADGAREGFIMDDRTPAIHAQPNQTLGIGVPTQPFGPTTLSAGLGTNICPYGTAYVYAVSAISGIYVNHPDPNNQLGTILATDTVVLSIIDPNITSPYTGAITGAGLTPSADAVTSNTTTFTAPGTGISIDPAVNPSLVTLVGGNWPAGIAYAGLSINFNGYSYVIATHGHNPTDFDLNGNSISTAATEAIIMGVYDGPALVNVPYTITGCQFHVAGTGSTLQTVNTASGATPPGFAFGYSQSTASNLVQVKVLCTRANGFYRNLGYIALGPTGGGTRQTVTDAKMNGNPNPTNDVRSASNPWVATDVGKTIVVDQAGTASTMLITTITSFIAVGSVNTADQNTSGNNLTNVRAWWGTGFISTTDGAMAAGSAHLTSASNPFVLADVGKTIMVAGAGDLGGVSALYSSIKTFVAANEVILNDVVVPAGGVTGKQAVWGGGTADATPGPTYAYAWYDPETGHCSNISPIYQVPQPTAQGSYSDFSNLTPVFKVDPGSLSYPNQATDGIRFSHILMFRTLSTPGASTLYPLGSLNPFIAKVHPGGASTRGTWNPGTKQGWMGIPNNYLNEPFLAPNTAGNYWYDFSSDSDLLLAGGFRAPQFTNDKPRVLLRGGATRPGYPYAWAYWDQRVWMANTQDPSVIQFSCDDAQCPLGLPEESFPPTNILTLPSTDGRVVAIRTLGDMLLVTTDKLAYTIAGNNESNYRLLRISTRMPGTGYYQMDEFSSDLEDTPAILYYFGRDGSFYEWIPGSSCTDISGPVSDIIKPLAASYSSYVLVHVHCASINGRRVAMFSSTGQIFTPLIFDIDNRTWTTGEIDDGTTFATSFMSTASPCFATLSGTDPPTMELFSAKRPFQQDITVRRWLGDNPTHSTVPAVLATFPLNFDNTKTRKQLCMVNAHVSGGTATCKVDVNEVAGSTVSMGTYAAAGDALYSIYGAGAVPVDSATAADLVTLTAQFNPANGAAPVGYRFVVTVTGTATTAQDVYAIDVGFKDYLEPGQVDP